MLATIQPNFPSRFNELKEWYANSTVPQERLEADINAFYQKLAADFAERFKSDPKLLDLIAHFNPEEVGVTPELVQEAINLAGDMPEFVELEACSIL